MVDDRHALEPVVAEDVIDVVLRVDEVAQRTVCLALGPHRYGPCRQLRRVDLDDAIRGDHEARVAAAELRRRVDVRGDALELEGRGLHRWPPGLLRVSGRFVVRY